MKSLFRRFRRIAPGPERSAHPRELLKSAGNVNLAIAALVVAASCIFLTVHLDSATEATEQRQEQQLAGLAFEQVRLSLTAQVAGLATNLRVPDGGSRQNAVEAARDSLLEALQLAPSALEVFLVEHGVATAGKSEITPSFRERFEAIRGLVADMSQPFGGGSDVSAGNVIRMSDRLAIIIFQPTNPVMSGATAQAPARQGNSSPTGLAVVYAFDQKAQDILRRKFLSPSLAVTALIGNETSTGRSAPIANLTGEQVGSLIWTQASDRAEIRFQTTMLACLLLIVAMAVGVISHRKRLQVGELVGEVEAQVYDVAMRDPLTGLLNRASFKRKLESLVAARQGNDLIGIVYVDLDRFKQVNDGFGHLKGDELLCAVTERLKDLSESGLTVARLGGDEFAMIVEDRNTAESIMALAERACEALGFPFQLGDVEALIGGSVGVSICPIDGSEHQELLRRADIAMYRAKTGGRGNTIRFDISMDNDVQELRALEADLRHAIERNELSLVYQPFWAPDGQTIVGVEALMRWNHPKRGLVSPGFFIPIAEESGLIHDMGEWAFETAMRQCKSWGGIILAVNVSPAQFKRPGLAARIKDIIAETGFEPERLEIEITEGVLMDDAEAAVKFMRGFKEVGVHIALDDFGTGFSSLSYLRRFPFDKLKVDQSFVRALGSGPGTAAIIHSVIALGRALGMTVHAEGVETLEHHIFLRAAGCHHLQGFLFSRPLKPSDVEALMLTKTIRPAMKPMFSGPQDAALLPAKRPSSGEAGAGDSSSGSDLAAQLRARVAEMKLALGGSGDAPADQPKLDPEDVDQAQGEEHVTIAHAAVR